MSLAIAYKMKKKKLKDSEFYKPHKEKGRTSDRETGVHAESRKNPGHSVASQNEHENKGIHRSKLAELKSMQEEDRKYLSEGGDVDSMKNTPENPVAKGMKKAFRVPMAKGGDVKGVHKSFGSDGYSYAGNLSDSGHSARKNRHMKPENREPLAKSLEGKAKTEHRRVLSEMKEMKHKDRKYLAEGGEITDEDIDMAEACENCGHTPSSMVDPTMNEDNDDMEMVDAIMQKRKGYSDGGQVANDTDFTADTKDAEYDDLVKRDELEFSYDGENSGDEEGNEQEDEDEKDVVSQIMKSRKKKDKMPRPA